GGHRLPRCGTVAAVGTQRADDRAGPAADSAVDLVVHAGVRVQRAVVRALLYGAARADAWRAAADRRAGRWHGRAARAATAMNFGLVIVGDEILSGKRQDKHMAKVIELLGARGLALSWVRYVGDDRDRITALLRDVFAGADAVFCCGGIGATPDDHTRQCAAAALNRPLELHPHARALILERMRDVAREQNLPYEPERP